MAVEPNLDVLRSIVLGFYLYKGIFGENERERSMTVPIKKFKHERSNAVSKVPDFYRDAGGGAVAEIRR